MEVPPPTPTLVFSSDSDWLLPWYAPGTPQASALCKQTGERHLSPQTMESWRLKQATDRMNAADLKQQTEADRLKR
jgi:hypothetical protein